MFSIENGVRLYVLIRSKAGHCGFPKGHIELDESEHQTAAREILEETGLEVKFIDGFRESNIYSCSNAIQKEVIYFLSEYSGKEIIIPENEILEFNLLPYHKAIKAITYGSDKEILEKAERWLSM